jgi:hypothetical protein
MFWKKFWHRPKITDAAIEAHHGLISRMTRAISFLNETGWETFRALEMPIGVFYVLSPSNNFCWLIDMRGPEVAVIDQPRSLADLLAMRPSYSEVEAFKRVEP